jgi:hypothetical protein
LKGVRKHYESAEVSINELEGDKIGLS